MPHAPVDHRETPSLEVHHNLGRRVVGNVDPDRSVRGQRVDTHVKPVEGKSFVLGSWHAIGPFVVGHVPVEGRVGEDQIHLAVIGEIGNDVSAVADVEPGVGLIRVVNWFSGSLLSTSSIR